MIVGGPNGPDRTSTSTFPFCSERCRAIDLGGWLDAAYRISAPMTEEDLDQGLPDGARASASDDNDDEKN